MTLEILTSDSLALCPSRIFTRPRRGLVSIFKGLNCGVGSSDHSDAVALNRARVAAALQVSPTIWSHSTRSIQRQ